nr:MAG TPA: hypothetical protein [Caudoviricetes sp.]
MVIYVNVDNCRFGFCPVYATVAGFVILVSAYLAFYSRLYAYMWILLTVIIELILDTFTGFIMVSGYCIKFWFIALYCFNAVF